MEILYFIVGIFSTTLTYSLYQLNNLKKRNKEILDKYQTHINISSIKYSEMEDLVESNTQVMLNIQSCIEKDQYEDWVKVNKKIEKITKDYYTNLDKIKLRDKTHDQNFSKISSEIQQLKNNIKALGTDPNFLSRY